MEVVGSGQRRLIDRDDMIGAERHPASIGSWVDAAKNVITLANVLELAHEAMLRKGLGAVAVRDGDSSSRGVNR